MYLPKLPPLYFYPLCGSVLLPFTFALSFIIRQVFSLGAELMRITDILTTVVSACTTLHWSGLTSVTPPPDLRRAASSASWSTWGPCCSPSLSTSDTSRSWSTAALTSYRPGSGLSTVSLSSPDGLEPWDSLSSLTFK